MFLRRAGAAFRAWDWAGVTIEFVQEPGHARLIQATQVMAPRHGYWHPTTMHVRSAPNRAIVPP